MLNLLRGSGTTEFSLSGLFNIRPKTSFCHVFGELCPYLIVIDSVCFYLPLFVFNGFILIMFVFL